MSYRKQLSRYALLVLVLVALAAGTTTATRWMPWSPLNSCLYCGGSNAAAPAGPEDQARAAAPSSTLAGRLGHSVTQSDVDLVPSSIGPAQATTRSPESLSARANNSGDGWQPWGNAASVRTGGSGDASVLSGLSRLASATISGGGSAVRPSGAAPSLGASAEHAEKPLPAVDAPTPAPPAPPAGAPAPRPATPPTQQVIPTAPIPPAPGGFTPPMPPMPAAPTGGPEPTAPFVEHHTPTPTAFVPPAPAGPIEPNGPSGTLPVDGSPSPTPEPASMILLATGVVAVLGELRRRRAM